MKFLPDGLFTAIAAYSYNMSNNTQSIKRLFDSLFDELDDNKKASIEDIFNAFGDRAYGPFLFILSVITISPISSIPGVSIILGALIILIAGQYFFKDGAPWIPKKLKHMEISADKAEAKLDAVSDYLEKLDRFIYPRLKRACGKTMRSIAMIIVIGLGVSMFPLAAVPWGVMLPGFAILFISLAIVARDGLLMICGLLVSIGALYAIVKFML